MGPSLIALFIAVPAPIYTRILIHLTLLFTFFKASQVNFHVSSLIDFPEAAEANSHLLYINSL